METRKLNGLLVSQSFKVAGKQTDKTDIKPRIDGTDRQIDNLVYELYGLTGEEICIVEEATKP